MIDLVAPIKEVTVYADRALITRVGSMHLQPGEQELRINDLPAFLRESLRAAGQGPQGTRILSVDITTAFHSRSPESELFQLQTACDLLNQRIDLLRARQDALKDRRQWLRALGEQSRDFAKGLSNGQMKPQDCADFFSFTAAQALQDAEAAQDLEVQLKQVQEERDAKNRELVSKRGSGKPDRLAAVVAVEIAQEGDFTLEISYLVTSASWHPQYEARVEIDEDGNHGEVELAYLGQVQQSSGENWSQVNLSLSTARPSQAALLPELQPRYLHVYNPVPLSPPALVVASAPAPSGAGRQRAAASFAGSDGVAYAKEMQPQAVEAQIATASVEQAGAAFIFRIARAVDIPSDNSPHKTTIAYDRMPCSFDYVCAPSLDPAVHLRARITNTSERVLLPGKSSIFLSGEYVGTTQIKLTAPKEELKIFLGIDDAIKIKREQTEHSVEKGALLQGDLRRITYAYRITVHNYAAFTRKLIVRDQVPVSQHERIKVKMQTISPTPSERTKLEILTWRFAQAAESESKIEYRYVVEHPQDMQVRGLP